MSAKVLVVEDDADINELMGACLVQAGMKYLPALTGKDGLRIAADEHPDVIVLDLMLPDVHGFEVARQLSAKRETNDIPIMVLSCMCQECDRKEAFGAGAQLFMNKPFNAKDMISSVQKALAWKAELKTRTPAGTIIFGTTDPLAPLKSVNDMIADIFVRTHLSEETAGKIREAAGLLGKWLKEWNTEHKRQTLLKLEYRVAETPAEKNEIEWKLSENEAGILANDFFKVTPALGGLMGWGAGVWSGKSTVQQPSALPERWEQILAGFGAQQFEKDATTQTVRLVRKFASAVAGLTLEKGAGMASGA